MMPRNSIMIPRNSSLLEQSATADKRIIGKELSGKTKFYEFYNAPITKYWWYSVSARICFHVFLLVLLVENKYLFLFE